MIKINKLNKQTEDSWPW